MRPIAVTLLAMASGLACAADDEADALAFADQTAANQPAAPAKPDGGSRLFTEGAALVERGRSGAAEEVGRLSIDWRLDQRLAPRWRLLAADRLDWLTRDQGAAPNPINSLKELYTSFQPTGAFALELGRINTRNGVAFGYNPTDFFRDGSIRFVSSPDPTSLRENRQGSVMLRTQAFWSSGSLQAIFSPELSQQRSDDGLSLDLAGTNNRQRWLVAATQQLFDNFSPQVLVYGDENTVQYGLNVTTLLSNATVGYLEWSGGKQRSLLDAVGGEFGSESARHFASKAAAGLTHTFPNRLSLSLEYQYNSTAVRSAELRALLATAPAQYGAYRQAAAMQQEPATRQGVFIYGLMPDLLKIKNLDLNMFVRLNPEEGSRTGWSELMYKFKRSDLALSWQHNSGTRDSEFGVIPSSSTWKLTFRFFL